MRAQTLLWICACLATLALAGFVAWIVALPADTPAAAAPKVTKQEADAALLALKPPKRQRPLVAVIGLNRSTETTDYLTPFGILKRSGVADVMLLATESGPVNLFPALKVEPHATTAEFDARQPEGADYVIVPAMSRDDDPAVLAWVRSQAIKGAIILGVCAGAKILATAGLLDGKRATTHWYYVGDMMKEAKMAQYIRDRRFVVDGRVATTTGITASMPMMLTVIEAIGGHDRAEAVARSLGIGHWDARHASSAFRQTRAFTLAVVENVVSFWKWEQLGIELAPAVDEISLALLADAWSRTYRSRALTFASTGSPIESRNGVRIIPDRVISGWPEARTLPAIADEQPASVLKDALLGIERRYGSRTARVVRMQLEYPWPATETPELR